MLPQPHAESRPRHPIRETPWQRPSRMPYRDDSYQRRCRREAMNPFPAIHPRWNDITVVVHAPQPKLAYVRRVLRLIEHDVRRQGRVRRLRIDPPLLDLAGSRAAAVGADRGSSSRRRRQSPRAVVVCVTRTTTSEFRLSHDEARFRLNSNVGVRFLLGGFSPNHRRKASSK